jgi:hypothetical protein
MGTDLFFRNDAFDKWGQIYFSAMMRQAAGLIPKNRIRAAFSNK